MFLVAAGLSLIFGVTRMVSFAHGSLYMLGTYVAYSLVRVFGNSDLGFWSAMLFSALVLAAVGAAIELSLLRRLQRSSELLQLLATFALVLILEDAVLFFWGADDLFAPRAPHLGGALLLFGHRIPTYDFVVMAAGPIVLFALWMLLQRSRFGRLIRAATQDRDMVSALGINQTRLFTAVFAVGAGLAGLGGALQAPRAPASLGTDLDTITTAFVVVVVGGMGSIPGAFVAAVIIGLVKALCVWLGTVQVFGLLLPMPKLTLVAEFAVMALVLVLRPYGLLGKIQTQVRLRRVADSRPQKAPHWLRAAGVGLLAALAMLPILSSWFPYATVILIEIMIAALYAASLYVLLSPAGMLSFGQAAYFGLGAYGSALSLKALHVPMELCLVLGPLMAASAAVLFGWFCVRLSGIYLAMLTLAFAQIIWAVVYQWDEVTGGSNGIIGIWPAAWLASPTTYYYLTLCLVSLSLLGLRVMIFLPLGITLRAVRDSPHRAEAIGIDPRQTQWLAFVIAAFFSGLAGALYAFSKGGVSPDLLSVNRSVDGLVMVLLGGIQSLTGPWVGAALLTWLSDELARNTDYWRAALGMVILLLVLLLPDGISGSLARLLGRLRDAEPGRTA